MLRYLQDSTAANATDDATRELHDYVNRVKTMAEAREGYMTFDDYICFQRKDERRDTKIQDVLELLEDYGEIPKRLQDICLSPARSIPRGFPINQACLGVYGAKVQGGLLDSGRQQMHRRIAHAVAMDMHGGKRRGYEQGT